MDLSGKVKLGRMFERVSASGRTYYAGRIGAAKAMLFRNDRGDEGEWELFVQDGGDRATPPANAPSNRQATPSPSAPSSKAPTPPAPSATGRRTRTRSKGAETAPIIDDDPNTLFAG